MKHAFKRLNSCNCHKHCLGHSSISHQKHIELQGNSTQKVRKTKKIPLFVHREQTLWRNSSASASFCQSRELPSKAHQRSGSSLMPFGTTGLPRSTAGPPCAHCASITAPWTSYHTNGCPDVKRGLPGHQGHWLLCFSYDKYGKTQQLRFQLEHFNVFDFSVNCKYWHEQICSKAAGETTQAWRSNHCTIFNGVIIHWHQT